MRKVYEKPQVLAQPMTLGVFGDYGNGDGGGGTNVDPISKVVERFDMRME
jgi:hypothetical protein